MGVHDAPQWLLSGWTRTCEGAGATASPEEIRAVGSRLIDRWSEPGRHFHNLKHLVHVLSRVDELAEETHEPDLVRLAAWYHGAIFDAAEKAAYANRGGEDEVASAELARAELLGLGVPQRSAERVRDLVTALARHTVPSGDFDCAVLCDADLAVLASEPQRYKAYLKDVRAEYAHVPVEDYLRARSAILTKLQNRSTLFASPLGAAWEEPARQNVAAELHRIHKELTALEQAHAGAAEHDGADGAQDGTAGTGDAAAAGASEPTATTGSAARVDASAGSPSAARGASPGRRDAAEAEEGDVAGRAAAARRFPGRDRDRDRPDRRTLPTFGRR